MRQQDIYRIQAVIGSLSLPTSYCIEFIFKFFSTYIYFVILTADVDCQIITFSQNYLYATHTHNENTNTLQNTFKCGPV